MWQAAEAMGICDHFHENLVEDHRIQVSSTWVKLTLLGAGLVAKGRQRGLHRKRRPRRPLAGMLLHVDAIIP